MLIVPIELPLQRASYRIVRLLRRWAAGADLGPGRIPSLVALGARIGVEPMAAVAVGSLFQLTEACLDRALVAECCCSQRLSRDERAILALLAAELPPRPNQANTTIPHGLPGALVWAVASVRQMLAEPIRSGRSSGAGCPFAASRRRSGD